MKIDVGVDAYTELGLNGRMNPLAAVLGDATFWSCLRILKEKQSDMLKLCAELNKLRSVTPIRFTAKRLLPTFYHLPVLTDDPDAFEDEMSVGWRMKYHIGMASFQLLPEQMKRMGRAMAVKSSDIGATKNILDKLYIISK